MSAVNVVVLFVYSLGMSFGQVLFKLAADQTKLEQSSTFVRTLLTSWYFFAAVLLYGVLSLVWVWILTRVPLSQAYPFIVLAFVFTPALAASAVRRTAERFLSGESRADPRGSRPPRCEGNKLGVA
jgi:hypothetical protein